MASWRDKYPVHPAAEFFPMMSEEELRALGEDIKEHGLTSPVVLWASDDDIVYVLDGRNRLDAMELLGVDTSTYLDGGSVAMAFEGRTDPWAFVVSANLRRRHLTLEQRIGLHAKLREQGKSVRAIAKLTGASKDTVHRDLASAGVSDETPDRVTGSDGKSYPASLPRITGKTVEPLDEDWMVNAPPPTEQVPALPDVSDGDVQAVLDFGANRLARLRELAGDGYAAGDMRLGPVAEVRRLAKENGIALPGDGSGYYTFAVMRDLVERLGYTLTERGTFLGEEYDLDLSHLTELDAAVLDRWMESLGESHKRLGLLINNVKAIKAARAGGRRG